MVTVRKDTAMLLMMLLSASSTVGTIYLDTNQIPVTTAYKVVITQRQDHGSSAINRAHSVLSRANAQSTPKLASN